MERIVLKHLSGSKANQVEEFPLNHVKELVLGRDPSSTVKYDPDRDDLVGRQHAKITQDPNDPSQFIVSDLNSRNGTFVNRQRIAGSTRLNVGDVVQLGPGGPEFLFEIEPRPQSSTKPTRTAGMGLPPTVQAPTTPVPQTRNVGTGPNPAGQPSYPTSPVGGSVGKNTVMRMINENVTEAKKQQSRKYIVIGGAAFLLLLIAVGAGGGFLWLKNRAATEIAERAQGTVSDDIKNRLMAPDAVAEKNRKAVVKIRFGWHLNAPDGRQLHQLYAREVPKSFERAAVRTSGEGLPCWVLIEGTPQNPKKVEPFLYDGSAQMIPGNNLQFFAKPMPISGYGEGTGFVVSSDGFILTARHVAAGWKTSYTFRLPENLGAVGGILYDPAKQAPVALLRREDVPTDWVPDRTRQELGENFQGRNDLLEVLFPGSINRIKADLVQASPTHDAALVKIHLPDQTPKVDLNDNYGEIKQGDPAVVLGYPAASPPVNHVTFPKDFFNRELRQDEIPDPTLSVGNIGRLLRGNENPFDRDNAFSEFGDAYQLTISSTGAGNSGGPVFDGHGNVVGIFFAGTRSRDGVYLTYAVPIKYGRELMSATGGK